MGATEFQGIGKGLREVRGLRQHARLLFVELELLNAVDKVRNE